MLPDEAIHTCSQKAMLSMPPAQVQDSTTNGRDALRVMDVLLGELLAVEPMAPAQVLPDEGDGHGCLIRIQLGHVQVVHEVHQLLVARWPVIDTGLQHRSHCHHDCHY